jgi:hypothetical protein
MTSSDPKTKRLIAVRLPYDQFRAIERYRQTAGCDRTAAMVALLAIALEITETGETK